MCCVIGLLRLLDDKLQAINYHCDVGVSSHHDWFRQSVLYTNCTEWLAKEAAGGSAGESQLIQLRGGASPERPGDEGTPSFKWLLRKI